MVDIPELIQNLIPGIIVTAVGGVMLGAVPGKGKYVGLIPAGIGLYLIAKPFLDEWAGVSPDSPQLPGEPPLLPGNGVLSVTVADRSTNLIHGATVSISGPITGSGVTNGFYGFVWTQGNVRFHNIPVGNYHVKVEAVGFETLEFDDTVNDGLCSHTVAILKTAGENPEAVHIASNGDRIPADIVSHAFMPWIPIILDNGGMTPGTSATQLDDGTLTEIVGKIMFNLKAYSRFVSIGGQDPNPLFEFAARFRPGDVRRLTGDGDVVIATTIIGNTDITFIAGWTQQDTINAVNQWLSGVG